MILYLGSSSLIKLYAREAHSDTLRDWVRVAQAVATCRIAYTEIVSALDLRLRKGDISDDDYDRAANAFNRDWEHFVRIDFDDREAGTFIKKYGLTRFGALHLSSAKLILHERGKWVAGSKEQNENQHSFNLFFSSTDPALVKAAAQEGLKILPLE